MSKPPAKPITEAQSIGIEVPMIPPSVNHYAQHSGGGHWLTPDSYAFKTEIAIAVNKRSIRGKRFSVSIDIVLGKKQKGDIDNFPKLVLDGLADADVFHDLNGKHLSDAHVRHLIVDVDEYTRPDKGFTVIHVEALR